MARRICGAACWMRSSDDASASMPVRYDGSTVTVYEITSSLSSTVLNFVDRREFQATPTERFVVKAFLCRLDLPLTGYILSREHTEAVWFEGRARSCQHPLASNAFHHSSNC